MHARSALCALALAGTTACGIGGAGRYAGPAPQTFDRAAARVVRVTRHDRSTVEVRDPQLVGDTLVGIAGSTSVRIPVRDVRAVEAEQVFGGRGLSAFDIALLLAVAVVLLVTLGLGHSHL